MVKSVKCWLVTLDRVLAGFFPFLGRDRHRLPALGEPQPKIYLTIDGSSSGCKVTTLTLVTVAAPLNSVYSAEECV